MERYFIFRIIFDYVIPFAILGIVGAIFAITAICSRIANKWAEREKRINDKLLEKREGNKDGNTNNM